MKTYSLYEAMTIIAAMRLVSPHEITYIDFEDGSKRKFNFAVNNGKQDFFAMTEWEQLIERNKMITKLKRYDAPSGDWAKLESIVNKI